MNLNSGTILHNGSYRVISTLGRGGFGITYLAEQILAKRRVCIKEFFPKDYFKRDDGVDSISILSQGHAKIMGKFKEKFIKEAQTIASLDHPNIIHIIDVFEENNTAYYVMEYVEGGSLNDIVKEHGVLSESVAVKYIKDVALALAHIHEENINHLDVKPGNIMVRTKGDTAILIDFGLSKHYDDAGDQTSSTPVGISNGYAPMEQYNVGGVSSFSPATDIYSLGATLYYLVTGVVPPVASVVGEEGIGALPEHLSSGVVTAINRSMSYWRKDRPQSIEEFLALLDLDNIEERTMVDVDATKIAGATVVRTESNPTSTNTPSLPSTPKAGRRGWLWATIVVAILAVGAGMFFMMSGEDKVKDKSLAEELFTALQSEDRGGFYSKLYLFIDLADAEQKDCYEEFDKLARKAMSEEEALAYRALLANYMTDGEALDNVEGEYNNLSDGQRERFDGLYPALCDNYGHVVARHGAEQMLASIQGGDIESVDSMLLWFFELSDEEQKEHYKEFDYLAREVLSIEEAIAYGALIATNMKDETIFENLAEEYSELPEDQANRCTELLKYLADTYGTIEEKSLAERAYEALVAGDMDAMEALNREYDKLSAEEQAEVSAELERLLEERGYPGESTDNVDSIAQQVAQAILSDDKSTIAALDAQISKLSAEEQERIKTDVQNILLGTLGDLFLEE